MTQPETSPTPQDSPANPLIGALFAALGSAPGVLILAALLGAVGGLPTLIGFPAGVIIVPLGVLLLGIAHRRRAWVMLPVGAAAFVGHLPVAALLVALDPALSGQSTQAFSPLPLLFSAGLTIPPLTLLGFLGSASRQYGRRWLAIAAVVLAVGYDALLLMVAYPPPQTAYTTTVYMTLAVPEAEPPHGLTLLLPLPEVAGETFGLIPAGSARAPSITRYAPLDMRENITLTDEYGPTLQIDMGLMARYAGEVEDADSPFPAGWHTYRAYFTARYPDAVPDYPRPALLRFTGAEDDTAPVILDGDAEMRVDLSVVLRTEGSQQRRPDPLMPGWNVMLSAFDYSEQIDGVITPGSAWQRLPLTRETTEQTAPQLALPRFG